MSRFIAKIGGFVLVMSLLFTSGAWLNASLLSFHLPPESPETTTLLLGDSHAQNALDPDYLENSLSLAKGAEPLFATHAKLVFASDRFPSLDHVVLAVGSHSLAPFRGEIDSSPRADDILASYVGFLGWQQFLAWRRADGWDVSWEQVLSSELRRWFTPNRHLLHDWWAHRGESYGWDHPYVGGFSTTSQSLLTEDALLERIEHHYGRSGVSPVQAMFLDSIAAWAGERGADLLLVATPVHDRYRARVPTEVSEFFTKTMSRVSEIDNVSFIDLRDLPLPDAQFRDYDHLNSAGAVHVSQAVRDFIFKQE